MQENQSKDKGKYFVVQKMQKHNYHVKGSFLKCKAFGDGVTEPNENEKYFLATAKEKAIEINVKIVEGKVEQTKDIHKPSLLIL